MTIYIKGYESPISESYYIEYWYNRHTRDWVVQVYDNYNRQQDSSYCPNKEWRDSVVADYSKEYNTNDIRKTYVDKNGRIHICASRD